MLDKSAQRAEPAFGAQFAVQAGTSHIGVTGRAGMHGDDDPSFLEAPRAPCPLVPLSLRASSGKPAI